jgi:hypothetical protein
MGGLVGIVVVVWSVLCDNLPSRFFFVVGGRLELHQTQSNRWFIRVTIPKIELYRHVDGHEKPVGEGVTQMREGLNTISTLPPIIIVPNPHPLSTNRPPKRPRPYTVLGVVPAYHPSKSSTSKRWVVVATRNYRYLATRYPFPADTKHRSNGRRGILFLTSLDFSSHRSTGINKKH